MKVKLSYTVDLDDVPGEINHLLEKAQDEINTISSAVNGLKETKDRSVEDAVKLLEEVRTLMVEADIVLEDCQSILSGYLSAKYSKDLQVPPLQSVPADMQSEEE